MASIEPTDYHDIVRVSDPQVSPGGLSVAFVRQVPDGSRTYESTIYTVSADGTGPQVPFSMEDGGDSQPRWSPSGDRLAFVSTHGTNDRPQLWVAPTDGGEARRITDVPGGVGSITWSPDGGRVPFLQEVKPFELDKGHDTRRGNDYADPKPDFRVTDRFNYQVESGYRISRRWESYFDGARTHVYIAELDSNSVESVTDAQFDADHHAPEWGDTTTLYYMRQ
jgi:dipeptidyl aminopeptidase/acylaminoacyl peptidase